MIEFLFVPIQNGRGGEVRGSAAGESWLGVVACTDASHRCYMHNRECLTPV